MQATSENYLTLIDQYSNLIGQELNPEKLPLLYLVAADWKTHGQTQNKWLLQKHGQASDQTFLTEEELRNEIDSLKNIQWEKQFLEIMAVFRRPTGQVIFHPLEYILFQN